MSSLLSPFTGSNTKRNGSLTALKPTNSSRMRFNKAEIASLASQPSHKFDKEGVLFVKEKQEGFFRRTEISVERWCRLRGNLLFYFKSKDHLSEPAGLIVLEDCEVHVDDEADKSESTFGILLSFNSGLQQHLATYTEFDRDSWVASLKAASHKTLAAQLDSLRRTLASKLASNSSNSNNEDETKLDSMATEVDNNRLPVIEDLNSPAQLELSFGCDNLLCDALGRSPSVRLIVAVHEDEKIVGKCQKIRNLSWRKIGQTEVIEKTSNPGFMKTIPIRENRFCLKPDSKIRISAFDYRERITGVCTLLGIADTTYCEIEQNARLRLKLESRTSSKSDPKDSKDSRGAGFVTVSSKSFENFSSVNSDSMESKSSKPSTDHPRRRNNQRGMTIEEESEQNLERSNSFKRRSRSVPPSETKGSKMSLIGHGAVPNHKSLGMLFCNALTHSYRFHSGLGGDINVQEIMAESRLSFNFPQQLLTLWICEEKESVHEIAGLGELQAPWHRCQMSWLENHLHLINAYSQALEDLDRNKHLGFRKSEDKFDTKFEFVPINLHLSRIWAENQSLRRRQGVYDITSHGAFTAHAQKGSGLMKMLKDLKSPQKDSTVWCDMSDKLQMAEDTLTAVRRARKDVVDQMRQLMKLAKEKKTEGMYPLVEEMNRRTKCLCGLLEQSNVEEAFEFLEKNRIERRPEKPDEFSESVSEFMQRNKLKIELPPLFKPVLGGAVNAGKAGGHGHGGVGHGTLQTPNTEFLSKELQTPEVNPYASLSGSSDPMEIWRTYSAYTSGYQSVDRLSDIDEFEETFRYLSVVDKTKCYYTLCKTGSPIDTPADSPKATPKKEKVAEKIEDEEEDEGVAGDEEGEVLDEGQNEEVIEVKVESCDKETEENPVNEGETRDGETTKVEEEVKEKDEKTTSNINCNSNNTAAADHNIVTDSPHGGLHYRAGDEPEPYDLTPLNIRAAMMGIASKVRVLCGKADSPTLSSGAFKTAKKGSTDVGEVVITKSASHESAFKIPDVPRPAHAQSPHNKADWAADLRPSMRKLRQGMDSLCKTSRLVCTVLRLQQRREAIELMRDIRYRRDVCFSHALTTVTAALMAKFWGEDPIDPAFAAVCCSRGSREMGPLVAFESLLTVTGDELTMFNDTVVAVEDLRNVEFSMVFVDRKVHVTSGSKNKDNKLLSAFPLPRVTGSRSSLKVLLPIPDSVRPLLSRYASQGVNSSPQNASSAPSLSFSVTPVIFNVGVNEHATVAGMLGQNAPQEKNNLDNFKILADYCKRFSKVDIRKAEGDKTSGRKNSVSSLNEPRIEDLLAILKNEVQNKRNKNVEILQLAALITRKVSGLRFTNCKSGKDRTGMSVTLEQVQILSRDYDLADHEFQRALDVLRGEGCRRDNCLKNIGHWKFAFTSIQRATFPELLKAPNGSYGSYKT